MRPIPSQHRGLHLGQGIQLEELADDPPPGQADLWPADVRTEPTESQRDGTADKKSTGAQGVRLPGGGRISRVSKLTTNKK